MSKYADVKVNVVDNASEPLQAVSNELKYQRVIQAMAETPWAILPSKLAVIRDLIAFRASGGKLTEEEIRARIGTPRLQVATMRAAGGGNGRSSGGGAVAVLPLVGTIIPRANLLAEISGAVSVQRFTQAFRQALKDPDVGSIVIDIDSSGGQVGAIPELAEEIFAARGTKRITAVANTLAASGAYWIGSAAGELIVTPSSQVGSIGVVTMHEDWSVALEQEGVAVSFIHAGKHKVEGNPYEPLDDEARAEIQRGVDDYYQMFIDAVARGRGVSAATVLADFGQGRVFRAKEAVRLGMADRIETLDAVVDRLLSSSGRPNGHQASTDLRRRRLRLNEQ